MKKVLLLTALFAISFTGFSQGKAKGKSKVKNNHSSTAHAEGKDVWEGPKGNTVKGSSKNQPKKVQAALLRDYPMANNVTWSKYKGDYTATFNNGPWRSTAVYHANGDRRDTRTPLTKAQLPGSNWDQIFKRDNIIPTTYIQIERPTLAQKIFRVLGGNNTVYFYDENGNKVSYDY